MSGRATPPAASGRATPPAASEADEPTAEGSERTNRPVSPIAARFRGFLPVVIDVETGGFNAETDALLEVAALLVRFNEAGDLELADRLRYLVKPFPGSRLEPASLEITGIDPYHPLRPAMDEGDALRRLFNEVRKEVKAQGCNRAVLVGHNSFFDLQFLNAAAARANVKRNPFHPFSSFDTATLAGVAFGQTVLSRAVEAAGLKWDDSQAHSALYDAEMAGLIFCEVVNRFRPLFEAAARAAATPATDGAAPASTAEGPAPTVEGPAPND